jgi:hypothetical protein
MDHSKPFNKSSERRPVFWAMRAGFQVFEVIRKHLEREGLRICARISGGFTAGKYARQFGYFSDSPAIIFLFEFYAKRDHVTMVIKEAVYLPLPCRIFSLHGRCTTIVVTYL